MRLQNISLREAALKTSFYKEVFLAMLLRSFFATPFKAIFLNALIKAVFNFVLKEPL
jgi:hypothetical protein